MRNEAPDRSLILAMRALRHRLKRIEASMHPQECIAQGKLDIALTAVEEAADLLGEGEDSENVCLSCERPLRQMPERTELDVCECDAAGATPAWAASEKS